MKRHRRNLRSRKSALLLEPLEARQLLSATVATVSPIWTINGTPGNDVISVAYNPSTQAFDLTINGVAVESRPAAKVRRFVIYGGAGDDTITVNTGPLRTPATIYGGDGNDTITGGAGNDTIYGGAGDDVIYGGDGNDWINGGDGNDTIYGGNGNDVIGGGAGNDTIDGGPGNDLIHGSSGNDILTGGTGNDTLYGDAGDDTLDGGAGNDRLFGGQGNDVLSGGAGHDALIGGQGNDTIYAVKGQDTFERDPHDAVIRSEGPMTASNLVGAQPTDSTQLPPVQISPELKQRLIDEAVARYRNLLGTTYTQYPWWNVTCYPGGGIATMYATSVFANQAGASATDYSTTNTQVQGVDEADLVETDGSFIYTVRNNKLVVIDVRDPANAAIASTMTIDQGSVVGLYLVGGRVVVLTQNYPSYNFYPGSPILFDHILVSNGSNTQTTAWVFDVSDPTNTTLVEKTTMSGSLASSRVIGHQLYLVLGNNVMLPAPQATAVTSSSDTTTTGTSSATSAISIGSILTYNSTTYQYQSEADYRQWLSDHINDYLPTFATTLPDGTTGPTGSLLGNFAYDTGTLDQITTIVDIDVTDNTPGPAALITATGSPGTVYATTQNMYVFTTQADAAGTTNILKFNLGAGSLAFDAAGHVDGTLLNSYSMDEYNGQLRVVTSYAAGSSTGHSLYVLSDIAGQLQLTGSLTNIGDNESLRSVLFAQDRAYIVTFNVVDPLFAIDLSDPANPVSKGELIMPGYSTYLYPLDHDHLIGIGRSPGSSLWHNSGVQVSLFDLSDLAHPTVVDQEIYPGSTGNWGSASSDALYDPHAFSYFPDQGVLAIPLDSWEGWSPASYTMTVLKVNTQSGFHELGQVKQDTQVQRSLRIGDNLYSLAQGDLKIVNLMQPSHVIADVVLPQPPVYVWPGRLVLGNPITVMRVFSNPITVAPLQVANLTIQN